MQTTLTHFYSRKLANGRPPKKSCRDGIKAPGRCLLKVDSTYPAHGDQAPLQDRRHEALSPFLEGNMKHIRNQKRSLVSAAAVSLAGALGLAGRAQAAEAVQSADGYVAADSIDGVASARMLPDGSVELVFEDGRTVTIPAGEAMTENGVILIAEYAAASAAAGEGVAASIASFVADHTLLAGAGLLGGGVAVAAATGAFDDEDTNDAPVFVSAASVSAAENSAGTTYMAQADDPEGRPVTYALNGGADAGLFAIDPATGALSFAASPDFETPSDASRDNAYEVVIAASDGVNTIQQTVTITVTDVNEAPVFETAAPVSVVENQTSAFAAVAADPDGDALTYSLEGADAALFAVDAATGLVTFVAAPDFEAPQDANGDNVYEVTVVASDGVNAAAQAYLVEVTDQIEIVGTDGADVLVGTAASEAFLAEAGDDFIQGNGAKDFIATGVGADIIAFAGDPFDGVDVSASGRQVAGNEDFVSDFDFTADAYQLNAADFGISGGLSFVSLDANAPGADIPNGANIIVLTNSDNDGDPATPFLATTAADQVAGLVETPGAGFIVYFNSNLNVNRLIYSSDLSDPTADLKIISRQTDLTGQAAIDALDDFTAANFAFDGETLTGTTGADMLVGAGGSDTIDALDGDDFIQGNGAKDFIATGAGADIIAFAGDPFDGVNVSASGRQVAGNEDFVSDFDLAADAYQLNAADFGISGGLSFVSLDANAPGADIPDGANVIVLTNSDNDGDPATPFLATTAADQVAGLVETPGAGFIVYFNSNLNVNRLIYSSDLSDPTADLKIISRQTDLTGQAAIDALDDFTAANFAFVTSADPDLFQAA
jgi:VCBS repeat-containing protein